MAGRVPTRAEVEQIRHNLESNYLVRADLEPVTRMLLAYIDSAGNPVGHSSQQYVIVEGNPIEGFNHYGPYSNRGDACDAALEYFTDWWVVELFPAKHLEPEEEGDHYGR